MRKKSVIKYGPHGKFLACPGFPECKFTKPYLEKVGVDCPVCGSDVVIRKTKKGRPFYSCEKSPECEFISWQKPSAVRCPDCGSYTQDEHPPQAQGHLRRHSSAVRNVPNPIRPKQNPLVFHQLTVPPNPPPPLRSRWEVRFLRPSNPSRRSPS